MTCPEWRRLAAHRLDRAADEPEGWPEALAHLDGCAACRGDALAADPTLVFRRLPRPEVAADAEADAMRQAVAAMRAGRRVEKVEAKARTGFAAWRRWAAAAALALAALSAGKTGVLPGGSALEAVPGAGGPAVEAVYVGTGGVPQPGLAQAPLVEDLNLPDAQVMQWHGEDLDTAMIYDAGLGV